ARPTVGGFQIETGGKGIGRAGEDHRMGFQVVEETARCDGQFDDQLFIKGVEVRLAVETHDGDAAALFDGHVVQLHLPSSLNPPGSRSTCTRKWTSIKRRLELSCQ